MTDVYRTLQPKKKSCSYCPSFVIFADTAYICWWYAWSGAVEAVLSDRRKQRVNRKSDKVYKESK